MKKVDVSLIIGKRNGKLTVIGDAGKNNYGQSLVLCQCDCGNEKVIRFSHFNNCAYSSCGCEKPKGKFRHGLTRTRTHSIWMNMRRRCEKHNSTEYFRYGAKGVSVCDRWKLFDAFLEDMGECPDGMTIDRLDNSKNYEPDNCRWATPKQQAENRTTQKFYEINGEILTLPDVAKKYSVNYRTLRNRIFRSGMSIEDAVSHVFGEITTNGLENMRAAVTASNKRRAGKNRHENRPDGLLAR